METELPEDASLRPPTKEIEPADPVVLSPVVSSRAPDSVLADEVARFIDPDLSAPTPLLIVTSPPFSFASRVDPAPRTKSPPRPEPLLPTITSIPPAVDCSLEPLRTLILPVDAEEESPDITDTVPDAVVSTPSTVSAHDEDEIITDPVASAVLGVSAKRLD